MQVTQSVRFGASILIVFNLLMSFACIWIFTRMAPVIDKINARNNRSLQACEEMLSALAEPPAPLALQRFRIALNMASGNITETGEPLALRQIRANYEAAFRSDITARTATLEGINRISEANRLAMIKAADEARQLGYAGAWGVVFMAIILLFAGLVFKRRVVRNLAQPFEEIDAVIDARHSGDRLRRCTGAGLPRDVERIYSGINEIIDHEGER